MIKPMKLKGIVQQENDGSMIFHGTLHDNSDFSIQVNEHDVQLNTPFTKKKNRVEGWLYIKQQAKQFDRVSITLPHPSLQHGHQILVHEYNLMPIEATLADFGAKKKPVGTTFPAKKQDVKKE